MKRKYLVNLEEWLNNEFRKPLIVWGARQVGKTYLIKDLFAKTHFKDNYIYVDCNNDNDFRKLVLENNNVQNIINYLSLKFNKNIDSNTLLIFDEAQECIPLISSLKYFCQDYRNIPVILTGSLIKMKLKRKYKDSLKKDEFLFPIGKINELTIYPLNFEEYLMNRNEMAYNFLLNKFNDFTPLTNDIHDLLLKIFNEYLILGGMPEVVDTFLKTNNYLESIKVLKELYDNYLADMELYQASNESIIRSKAIFNNIFGLLNRESKNFSPSFINPNTRNRDYVSPIDWLELSFLVNKSSQIKEKVSIPLTCSNNSLFRLYLSDMGMFTYQSKLPLESFLQKDINNTLSGIYYENYVAMELKYAGYDLYYWNGKGNSEFEFIIQYKNDIIPIDVKKSRGNLNSLEKFRNHNKYNFSIKISANNFGYDEVNKIVTVPYYAAFLLFKKLKQN